MDYQEALEKSFQKSLELEQTGQVAQYIPELKDVDPDYFGATLCTLDGMVHSVGNHDVPFSIQSIAKVLSLTFLYSFLNENLWKRVGMEPTASSFNSLLQLEKDKGIPRNPLINAGAIVVCDMLLGKCDDACDSFLVFLQELSENDTLTFNSEIAESEKSVGYQNLSLAYLLKSMKNLDHSVEEVLDFYFHVCSVEMTTQTLARTFLFLANDGKDPFSKKRFVTESQSRRVNTIMQLCGFYDQAGEFSFRVGVPGKSGVGGGIVVVCPGKYTLAVWSPPLNEKGNSLKGLHFLEHFTTLTETSIF